MPKGTEMKGCMVIDELSGVERKEEASTGLESIECEKEEKIKEGKKQRTWQTNNGISFFTNSRTAHASLSKSPLANP